MQTVVIDFSAESVRHYRQGYAIIAIDVIRATTTAITAVAQGRRCFPVPSFEVALPLAAELTRPLLVGELGGNKPYGFDLTNSPAQIANRSDVERPIILLSTSGTLLIHEAGAAADAVYLACFRNYGASARYVAARHQRVAVIGASTRGEFREEDQMGCALVAAELMSHGFAPEDQVTTATVSRWTDEPPDGWMTSKSVRYLRDTGQADDLEFIRSHINDVPAAFSLKHGEVLQVGPLHD